MKILQLITLLMIMFNSFLFTQMKHPLSIGFTLLIQTLLICLISGMFYQSFWFSYILFLIFLGGMLVLFIYVISLASNEKFYFSMKLFIMMMTFFFIFIIIFFFIDKSMILNFMNNEMKNLTNLNMFINENSINLNKLYNFPSNMITVLLINYLFFTLIVIVKITNFFFGPLRMMF